MKKLYYYLISSMVFLGCADFVEYPLEKVQVSLQAPIDSLVTTDSIITFWWDTHQDAKFYRIQVVNPNFEKTHQLIADSLVDINQLTLKLKIGDYQWRVRPENYGSSGLFSAQRNIQVKE